jgi:hypothetical protein
MVGEEFIQRWVRRVRHEVPDGVAVFLVGSYARGDAGPYSDVDLDVLVAEGPRNEWPTWFDVEGIGWCACRCGFAMWRPGWPASRSPRAGRLGFQRWRPCGCVGSPTSPGGHDWSDHSWPTRLASRNWTGNRTGKRLTGRVRQPEFEAFRSLRSHGAECWAVMADQVGAEGNAGLVDGASAAGLAADLQDKGTRQRGRCRVR